MSRDDDIEFLHDKYDDPTRHEQDELDIQDYDEIEEPEHDTLVGDEDEDSFDFVNYTPPELKPFPNEFELPSLALECGDKVSPGEVVELLDDSGRHSNHRLSGDFLLVRYIMESVEGGEIVLRGYRMRRCAYLMPLFDNKLNDLFMLLEVRENDSRPRFVQGLIDVRPEQVKSTRKCVFTHLRNDLENIRTVTTHIPARLKGRDEIRDWVFDKGKLLCRWVLITELHPTAQSCGGEKRFMYKREVTAFTENRALLSSSSSNSLPSSTLRPTNRPSHKGKILTFGDGYCCSGGASAGAQQAGYQVKWGLDLEPLAIEAYRKNFPDAQALKLSAHNFPDIASRCTHGCDHLHMSCPCCYWSESHTVEGKNDEANMLTIYTVGPWLRKVKPLTFSLEQAPGLLKLSKHKLYFRALLRDIGESGYNVRWRIQDQAWFGVPQHRRRLIIVGAKISFPLPPFPAPVHGPPKSGLRRYVTIGDSLNILEGQPAMFRNDPYHQPSQEKKLNKEPFDPHVRLAKCITTSGGDNVHYSGKRANTVRELALMQNLPPKWNFTGSITEARKMAGNAWPPAGSKHVFLNCAATLEAFEHGFINAEDEILDLYDFLEAKGFTIPEPAYIDVDEDPAQGNDVVQPEFRYLSRIQKTVKPNFLLSLWAKPPLNDPLPLRRKKKVAAVQTPIPVDDWTDDVEEIAGPAPRANSSGRRRKCFPVWIDGDKEPTWFSESESE